jgi:hypothetical protein
MFNPNPAFLLVQKLKLAPKGFTFGVKAEIEKKKFSICPKLLIIAQLDALVLKGTRASGVFPLLSFFLSIWLLLLLPVVASSLRPLLFGLVWFDLVLGVWVRWSMASSVSGDADAISRAVAEACKAQEWSKGIRLLNKLPDTITSPRLLWYVFYFCMYVCMHPCTTIVRPPSSPFSWNLLHCCPLGGERE